MATERSGEMYTAGKLAKALGISQGKIKKLIEAQGIQPDEVNRGCKYCGSVTLEKLKATLEGVIVTKKVAGVRPTMAVSWGMPPSLAPSTTAHTRH